MFGSLSSFLVRMGPSLGNHLWQSTVFAGVAALMAFVLRRRSASVRCTIWMVASAKFLIPFALLMGLGNMIPISFPTVTAPEESIYYAMNAAGVPFNRISSGTGPSTDTSGKPAHLEIMPELLFIVWICGALTVALVWSGRWWQVSAILRKGTIVKHGREFAILRELELQGMLRRQIPLVKSREMMEPAIFGILRPRILWPAQLTSHLDDQQIKAILAHELAHVRRRDNLIAALHMLVEVLLWFYPLVWWLESRIAMERERACDEAVLQITDCAQVYAEGLLRACRVCVESTLPVVPGIASADLRNRIVRIVAGQVGRRLNLGWKLFLGTAGLVSIGVPVVLGSFHFVRAQTRPTEDNSWEQAAGGHREFEVAAIHLGEPGKFKPPLFPLSSDNAYSETGGRFFADFPLSVYIEFAYKLLLTNEQRTNMLSRLPKWVSTDEFVIEAKAPGDPTKDQMRLMVQALLRDRFKLAVHFENQVSPVFAVVLDKPGATGPKLRPHSEGPPCDPKASLPDRDLAGKHDEIFPPICDAYMLNSNSGGKMKLGSRNTTMDLVAQSFPTVANLGRPVVDQTGLSGRYDFTLEWNPESDSATPADAQRQSDIQQTTFLEALHDQLGLKLREAKAPVKVIVIDHIDKPSPN